MKPEIAEADIINQQLEDIARVLWTYFPNCKMRGVANATGLGERATKNLLEPMCKKDGTCVNPGLRSLLTLINYLEIPLTELEYKLDPLTVAMFLVKNKLLELSSDGKDFIASDSFKWQLHLAQEICQEQDTEEK